MYTREQWRKLKGLIERMSPGDRIILEDILADSRLNAKEMRERVISWANEFSERELYDVLLYMREIAYNRKKEKIEPIEEGDRA